MEEAILDQLTGLYRDGSLIREAIQQASAEQDGDRTALAEQRASLSKEIARAERAIERYQDAFETGNLDPARFKDRLAALDTRLDALREQDQALVDELAAGTPTTPDSAQLAAVADQLGRVIADGDPDQAKALLRILIAELRVNSRSEVLPTYRVGTPVVCAPTSSVGLLGAYSNAETQDRLRRLADRLDRVAASHAPRRLSARHDRRLRSGLVPNAIMQVLMGSVEPIRARDIHAEVEDLIGQPVSPSAVKNWLAKNVQGSQPVLVRLGRGRYRLSAL